jgi:D-alanyl-D-alanine carboxypeptidase
VKHQLRHSAAIVVLSGLAIVAAGCSDARLAANNAASNGGQPNNGQVQPTSYQTGYGLTSDGPTTDLYHEFKHSLEPPERPQVAATVQQGAPAPVNGQQVADSSTGPGAIQQSATQQGVTQQGVTQQGVAQQGVAEQPVAQQPAAPPREAPTATVYGMSSDGPTTDVYTALFGRNH